MEETLRRLYDSPIGFAKVMVSDNASTDDTAPVLARYKSEHANFDFKINKTNIGPLNNFLKATVSNRDCAAFEDIRRVLLP